MAPNIFLLLCLVITVSGLELQQVLIIGRHNVRAPLLTNLEKYSSRQWPKWDVTPAFLTPKGALLQTYMGKYFYEWFLKEGFLTKQCPDKESVYVYSNTPQRTRESARILSEAIFPGCNITPYYRKDVLVDPVFNPVINNDTEAFKEIIFKEMQKKFEEINLEESYNELNRILDLKNSKACKDNGHCDLNEIKNEIYYKVGDEPNVIGPLRLGNSIVDSILMEYYNGNDIKDVAFGQLKENSLELLTRITKENQNVRFNSTEIVKDVAGKLLGFISKILIKESPRLTIMIGHDSNLTPLLLTFGFKPFKMINQLERTPVGGMLVFKKYYDKENDRKLLKIDYVYQSMDQLREAKKLSLDEPPMNVSMELQECETDKNGFCKWDDFIENVIKKL